MEYIVCGINRYTRVEGLDVGLRVVGAEEGESVLVGDVVVSIEKIANA